METATAENVLEIRKSSAIQVKEKGQGNGMAEGGRLNLSLKLLNKI